MTTQLSVLKFNTPAGADDMLELLKAFQKREFIELYDAVVITKADNQQVQVRQPLGANHGKGAAWGALTGALVGLVGGPVGAAVGLVSGALVGGAAASSREPGSQEADLESMAIYGLQSGESGLLLYYDEVWRDQLEGLVKEFNAKGGGQIVTVRHQTAAEAAGGLSKEKVEAAYKSWQEVVDKQRAALAALRQQTGAAMQSDRNAAQQQVDQAKAELNQLYQTVLHTLHDWQQQLDTHIHQLEAEAKSARGKAKTDIERRLASAREARQTLHTRVKDTLSMRLNDLKADIETLQAQAAQAQGQAKAKLNQRVTQLQAEWDAEQKRLAQLENAEDAAWDQMVNSIDTAIDTFDASVRAAEMEYEKVA